jgi:hypothetical protein
VLRSLDKNSFAKLKKIAKVATKVAVALRTRSEKNSPASEKGHSKFLFPWPEKSPPAARLGGIVGLIQKLILTIDADYHRMIAEWQPDFIAFSRTCPRSWPGITAISKKHPNFLDIVSAAQYRGLTDAIPLLEGAPDVGYRLISERSRVSTLTRRQGALVRA